jgi:ParB/RepB/Spo0J family partition protein
MCLLASSATKRATEHNAESIRVQGVLSPLLVRPLNERGFEIVAEARRYRAAQMVEAETVPVRIVNLTDAEALEAQLIENLIRADVHPMEEATGGVHSARRPPPRRSRIEPATKNHEPMKSSFHLCI